MNGEYFMQYVLFHVRQSLGITEGRLKQQSEMLFGLPQAYDVRVLGEKRKAVHVRRYIRLACRSLIFGGSKTWCCDKWGWQWPVKVKVK